MNLIERIFSRRPQPQTQQRDITLSSFNGVFDQPTRSGVNVSEQTALGIPALWSGIRIISADVGSLEPVLYRECTNGQRSPAIEHPLYDILACTPNSEMTRPVFWETLMSHALLWGGMYAEIARDGAGRVSGLWLIHPRNVSTVRTTEGKLIYRVIVAINNLDPEHEPGQQIYINQEDMFAVPGLSPDGVVGHRLLNIARETIGFGIATQRYGSSFFGNSARPSGTLSVTGSLNDQARENLRRSWQSLHAGVENTGKTAILEEGMKFEPFQLTNEQSQYKDILDWFGYQVAQLLCIPATKIGVLGRATWANLETLNTDYLTTTLRPWLEKIEAEIERKLLTETERRTMYVEFDTTALLRADIGTRYNAYAVALSNKFMTVDEVRARENLPPLGTGATEQEPEVE